MVFLSHLQINDALAPSLSGSRAQSTSEPAKLASSTKALSHLRCYRPGYNSENEFGVTPMGRAFASIIVSLLSVASAVASGEWGRAQPARVLRAAILLQVALPARALLPV